MRYSCAVAPKSSKLQQELHQRMPFRSTAQEAVLGLIRTADFLQARAAELLTPHGITPQQYNVLRILRGAEPQGLPTLEVAARMIERAPGITRLLDRLHQKKLVRRARSQSDRRQVVCRVTSAGLELLATLDQPVLDMHARSTASLSEADQLQLIHLLDTLRKGPEAELSAGRDRANAATS